MTVFITLTLAGINTDLFLLLSDSDGFTSAFESDISRADLMAGYACSTVPNDATIIRVLSTGECTNYVDLVIDTSITTTTTTIDPSITTTTTTSLIPPTTTTTTTTIGTTTTTTTLYDGMVWNVLANNDGGCSGTEEIVYSAPGTTFTTGTLLWGNPKRTLPFNIYFYVWDQNGGGSDNQYVLNGQTIGVSSGTCPV